MTHLATDKPLYKPGETVYFRSLTLDRATFKPPETRTCARVPHTKPGGKPEPIVVNGEVLRHARGFVDGDRKRPVGPDKKLLRGIGCGDYRNPPDAAGRRVRSFGRRHDAQLDGLKQRVVTRMVLETRKFNVIEYKPETS